VAAGRRPPRAFFDELGDEAATIQAAWIDMSGGYEKAVREAVPPARICFDPTTPAAAGYPTLPDRTLIGRR
jgi:transposase